MNPTILIVDDETDLADTCRRLLHRQGWMAVVVATRAAALDALSQRPVLALVDRRLPDGDGLDVLRAAVGGGTPAIMMSGYDWADSRRVSLDAGAAGFLGKPFPTQALLELIDEILGPAPRRVRPDAPGGPVGPRAAG
jgi:DNA-binding response OmpR family regulator